MTPKEATQELNKEYAHHAHLLGESKAIMQGPDNIMSLREFKVQIDKVSFSMVPKLQFQLYLIINLKCALL